MKKILSFILIFMILVVSGCRSDKKIVSDGGEIVWRPMIPNGFAEQEMQGMEKEWESVINKILEKEKKEYKVQIDFLYEPNSAEDMSVLTALKECKEKKKSVDLISVLSGTTDMMELKDTVPMYQACVENNILMSLDDWLKSSEGKKIRTVIPNADLQNAKIDGVTYGISAVLPQTFAVAYSKEIMEKCGIREEELSSNLFENEQIFRKVKENTDVIPYKIYSADILYHQGYWMETNCETLGYGGEGKFVNILEVPEYQQQMMKLSEWKQQGLLDTMCDKKTSGKMEAFAAPLSDLGIENYRTDNYELIVQDGEEQKNLYIVPNPKEPFISPYWGDNKVGIASWTNHKENALDFMMELLTNPEIANFLQYGVEGRDYTVNEKQEVQFTEQASIVTRFFGYQYTNPLITLPMQTMPSDKFEAAERFHEQQEKNIPRGFRLDIRPVAGKIKKVNYIYKPYQEGKEANEEVNELLSLTCNDLEQTIQNIIKELKDAGMDEIVEEANNQLKEWKKNNTKVVSNDFFSSCGEDIIESKEGFYRKNAEGFLYFFDFDSEKEVLVCNKANCKHEPWDEAVLPEERCNAYISGVGNLAGIVEGKNLYLFEQDMDNAENVWLLVKSNLNRDSRKILAEVNMNMPWSYARKGDTLYLPVNQSLLKEEEGVITQDTKVKSNLCQIDLKSGEMKEILKEQEKYNGAMEILSAAEDELYLSYTYFENEFDGTNFEEANEQTKYYRYDIKSGVYKEIFSGMKNQVIRKMTVYGEKIYMVLADKEKESAIFKIAYCVPGDNKIVTIKECSEWPWLFQDCVIYKEAGKDQASYIMYQNPDKEKEIKTDISNRYIKEAGEYLLIEQDGVQGTKLVKKKDFLKGKDTGISIH